MIRFLSAALLALLLGACAADNPDRSSGGSTSAGGSNVSKEADTQDMRGSSDTAPGAQGDRRRPADTAPKTTY
jgi:hypothetical protein